MCSERPGTVSGRAYEQSLRWGEEGMDGEGENGQRQSRKLESRP